MSALSPFNAPHPAIALLVLGLTWLYFNGGTSNQRLASTSGPPVWRQVGGRWVLA